MKRYYPICSIFCIKSVRSQWKKVSVVRCCVSLEHGAIRDEPGTLAAETDGPHTGSLLVSSRLIMSRYG